jgi:hypothetical protein
MDTAQRHFKQLDESMRTMHGASASQDVFISYRGRRWLLDAASPC